MHSAESGVQETTASSRPFVYASIGLQNVAVGGLTLTQGVGCLEIVLAVAVLIAPLPSLRLGICLWKMGTERLFLTSGSLPFEWVERAGSYTAPLALYALMVTKSKPRQCQATVGKPASGLSGAGNLLRRSVQSLQRRDSSGSTQSDHEESPENQ